MFGRMFYLKQVLLFAVLAPLAICEGRGGVILTGNLLVNPGAESGDLTGWTPGGDVFPFVASPGTIPPHADLGFQPRSGNFYFVGGRSGSGFITQRVSLLAEPSLTSGLIDSGDLRANATVWHMNFDQRGGPIDTGQLTITFLNSTQQFVGSFTSPILINSVTNNAGPNDYRSYIAEIPVPIGTRFIDFRKDFFLGSGVGSDTDVYYDDSALAISVVPEPNSFTLLSVVGVLACATYRIRRQRTSRSWLLGAKSKNSSRVLGVTC